MDGVKAEDFFAYGVDKPGNTINKPGSNVRVVNVNTIPGLNTLGISMARIDFSPRGLNPPHTHPHATEILTLLEGELYVGFVTSNIGQTNRLFTKILKKGDVFVFPQGLVHIQFNRGHTRAVAIAALNSQNPGTITIAMQFLAQKPPYMMKFLLRHSETTEEGPVTCFGEVHNPKRKAGNERLRNNALEGVAMDIEGFKDLEVGQIMNRPLKLLLVIKEEFREDGAGEGPLEGPGELVVREMEDVEVQQGAKEVGNQPYLLEGGESDEKSTWDGIKGIGLEVYLLERGEFPEARERAANVVELPLKRPLVSPPLPLVFRSPAASSVPTTECHSTPSSQGSVEPQPASVLLAATTGEEKIRFLAASVID
ncbi:hypothetical protein ZIOFF_046861 [Zingiber officinale]|uniref:Cupin type-1 domain-containing protein n=1 Tax=Zingiber officinale TaxID=94328 RepID=A0A8J5G5D2_ZINOF|nr:hypothetical protein ZIOFF_046861 [Zingiber officinale]